MHSGQSTNKTQPTTHPSHSEPLSTDSDQLSTTNATSTQAPEIVPTTIGNAPTSGADVDFHKKSRIFWNKIKKNGKKAKNVYKNSPTENAPLGDKQYTKRPNFTDETSCLSAICKHLGICDFEDMSSKDDGGHSNCTCVERMKGKCGVVVLKKRAKIQPQNNGKSNFHISSKVRH